MSFDATDLGGPYATIFDVGAFRAEFAKACVDAWPGCIAECFEPLEPEPLYIPAHVHWHSVALGPKAGITYMHRCEFLPSSSMLVMTELHKEAFPYTRQNEDVQVQVRTLDDYYHVVLSPALLKIDVQGYELEVLRGGMVTLNFFQAVALEINHAPLYADAPSPEDVGEFLTAAGFRHAKRLDVLFHPRTGQLLQSDELWLR